MPRVILIVDDDCELCELVGELLRAEGFDVEAHHTGEGAVELAAGGRFALVILDVMLPVQNGFEILRALRNRSAVPVILLTARGEDIDRIVGLEIGADDYLPKPFNSRAALGHRRRAIENVVRNGSRYTPEGTSVDISVATTTTHARIVVRDHGPGVPPEEIDRIFLPFHRVGALRDRNSGGTGLGLSIAARAAGVHGGTIRARNADGGGLEVAIDLPLYKALHSLAVS